MAQPTPIAHIDRLAGPIPPHERWPWQPPLKSCPYCSVFEPRIALPKNENALPVSAKHYANPEKSFVIPVFFLMLDKRKA